MTENKTLEIDVPRDRNGTFEPVIVLKYEKRTTLFNNQIISLYTGGMITRDIKADLEKIYGIEVSPELVSRVTDASWTSFVNGKHGSLMNRIPSCISPCPSGVNFIDGLSAKVDKMNNDKMNGTNNLAYFMVFSQDCNRRKLRERNGVKEFTKSF